MEKNEHPFDFSLVFIVFLFSIISFLSISTAQEFGQYNENFLVKQIAWYIVGCGIILAVMYFDMEQIERMQWFAYGFAMLLLIFLILAPESIARPVNGAVLAPCSRLNFPKSPSYLHSVILFQRIMRNMD
jgi:rod shape determining protein RodA